MQAQLCVLKSHRPIIGQDCWESNDPSVDEECKIQKQTHNEYQRHKGSGPWTHCGCSHRKEKDAKTARSAIVDLLNLDTSLMEDEGDKLIIISQHLSELLFKTPKTFSANFQPLSRASDHSD